MIKEIFLLTDYKNHFGSKYNAVPYNSGMDLEKIEYHFKLYGFEILRIPFYKINFKEETYRGKIILYTSSEDTNLHYKDYIEDIVLALELSGALIIPRYKYLRANNNKVFMEILRNQLPVQRINSIYSNHYGTLEELMSDHENSAFNYPLVIKPSAGAMSRGVALGKNFHELRKIARKISRSKNYFREIWEIGRSLKYKGYVKESKFRKKFIVQNFIKNLDNDWKVLVFGERYYVLKRLNRKGDFRASGGGRLSYSQEVPDGLLDFAKTVFNALDVPHISLDIAFDGNSFHLFEFQALYFGSYTLTYAEFYFVKINGNWIIVNEKSEIEKVYVDTVVEYLKKELIS